MDLRRLIPFFDSSVQTWATEARILRWLTFLWLFIGLAVLFSASYPSGIAQGDGLYYFKRQLIAVGFGLAGFHLLVHTPLRRALLVGTPFFIICLGFLFATHIPGLGQTEFGATRWLSLGAFSIQPSELLKPFLILQSAQVFSHWERLPWKKRGIWLTIFIFMLLGILVQPSLSTSALCALMLWLVALAAGLSYFHLWGAAGIGILAAAVSISKNEYQQSRVMSFLNPWADPAQDGYQLIQSLLATGSGGIWGTGFGLSQQKWFYLPLQHTDFIFAVFAEEFGLAGSFLLLLLLATYSMLALRVAMKTPTLVHRLVVIGAMVLIVGQSCLNIGVATGALPTTGLPFPLFSYGGNSMIASLLIAGLIVRVARENNEINDISPDLSGDFLERQSTSYNVAGSKGVSIGQGHLQNIAGSGKPDSTLRHRSTHKQKGSFWRQSSPSNVGTSKTIGRRANKRSRRLR